MKHYLAQDRQIGSLNKSYWRLGVIFTITFILSFSLFVLILVTFYLYLEFVSPLLSLVEEALKIHCQAALFLAALGLEVGLVFGGHVGQAADREGQALDGLARLNGASTGAAKHQHRRRLRAEVMVRAMDAFAAAYRLSDPGLNWLRNVAVDLLNCVLVELGEVTRDADEPRGFS